MNSKSLSNARNVSMYTKIDVDMQENLMSVQYIHIEFQFEILQLKIHRLPTSN